MELYSFYNMGVTLFMAASKEEKIAFLWGPIVGAAIWIAFFILQGFGLYAMAKRLGMKKKWLAFTPFANIYYMGKLAGACGFFGHKMKNAGLYAMIAQILATVFTVLYILAECFLYYNYGTPVTTEGGMLGSYHWNGLSGFSLTVYGFYEYGMALLSILSLISQVLMLILVIGLFQKYSPKNYRILAVLSFMFAPARFITIFVLRNRQAIDFEEYTRQQREAYMRRYRQQYYGGYNNPYGGNYGNGNYGGSNQPNQPNQPKPDDEPFGEFSSQSGQSSGNAEVDEFFN